jgi:hypothetical protein
LDDIFIPFQMDGNTLYFDSRVPSNEELENCPYRILTDDTEWDPNTVDLNDPKPKEMNLATTRNIHKCEWEVRELESPNATMHLAQAITSNMRIVSEVASSSRHSSATRWHSKMTTKSVPKRLWDFGIVHQAEIMS